VTCYNLSNNTSVGDSQRGPLSVEAVGLNTIRYDYQFGNVVTYGTPPDLWTNLSTLATAQVPAPVAKSGAKPPAAPIMPSMMPENKAGTSKDPTTVALTDAIDQSASLRSRNDSIHRAFSDKEDTFLKPIDDLRTHSGTLLVLQNAANNAIASSSQAKAALTAYLTASTNDITALISTTATELSENGVTDILGHVATADSAFVTGIKAKWPAVSDVTKLQSDLVGNATELSNANQQLAGYAPGELTAMQASEAALTDALVKLKAANAAFGKASHKVSDPALSQSGIAEEKDLATALDQAKRDEAALNKLTPEMTLAIAQNATTVTGVNTLAPTSSTYSAFVADHESLSRWQAKMTSKLAAWKLHQDKPLDPSAPDPFARTSSPATCAFAFSRTKDTVVTLTRVDLTPATVPPAPQTVLTVTVECTSPFSISAGVAFSTIPDSVFAIAATPVTPGSTTTQNTITQTTGSNFHPLPLALINIRLHEWNDTFALYGSFGVAANIRQPTSGGSAAEYLFGPSIGLFRTAFITAGVHLGNEASVGGGYSVGAPVPSTLTTVPLNTSYRPGFGLGITFTKP
jgi:hypothetical protein